MDIPGVADHRAGDVDWLADGARAVGDGQSGGLYQTSHQLGFHDHTCAQWVNCGERWPS
jgi:hypothetical protein